MEKENKTTKCATSKELTLLKAVETIVEKSCDSQLCDLFLKQCKKEIKLVAEAYNITPQQAILFCITVECGPRNVSLIELSHHLNMRNVASLSFDADIKAMIKMRLMRYRNREREAFDIPEHVISALQENKAQILPKLKVEDAPAMLDLMGTWFNAVDNNNISPEDLGQDLLTLYKDNLHISFARKMLDLKLPGKPALADDSGICADALGGKPGIHSARFAGEQKSDKDNNAKLSEMLQPFENKKVYYACCLVLMRHEFDPMPIIAEGVWEGIWTHNPRGENGFGYDPHFYIPEYRQTAAEISGSLKNRISHRGLALIELMKKLDDLYLRAGLDIPEIPHFVEKK